MQAPLRVAVRSGVAILVAVYDDTPRGVMSRLHRALPRSAHVRLGSLLTAAILGALLVGIFSAGASAKPAKRARTVRCTATLIDQSGAASHGFDLGLTACRRPLGSGLVYLSYNETVSGASFTITGKGASYFKTGTVRYTYKNSGSTATGKFTGRAKVTGGTGAWRHVKGTGRFTCAFKSQTTAKCSEVLKLSKA